MKLWLTRDGENASMGPWYKIWGKAKKPIFLPEDEEWQREEEYEGQIDLFCFDDFEKCTGYKLKPGAGPVRIKIHIEEVK